MVYTRKQLGSNQIQTEDEVTNIQDSNKIGRKFGLEGQMSAKTLVRLMAGAGGSTYGDPTAADAVKLKVFRKDSVLMQVSVLNQQRVKTFAWVQACFQDVYFTNFNLYHQLGLTYEVSMMDRAVISVNGQYRN